MLILQGQRALITGATGAIGQAIARRFAAAGAGLVLTGRDNAKLTALAGELTDCSVAALELTDPQAVKAFFAGLSPTPLTLLVNCAGIMKDSPLAMTRLADLEAQWQLNVAASYQCCQLASRLMVRQRRGVIINLASQVGEQGAAGQSAYAATKAAMTGMTKALAAELGPVGIRVNALAPGFIETPLTAHYDDDRRQRLAEKTRLKRLGSPDDVAGVALFLASDLAAYVTGQVLAVDGGLRL